MTKQLAAKKELFSLTMEKSRINFPNLFTKQTEKHNHNRETELEIA